MPLSVPAQPLSPYVPDILSNVIIDWSNVIIDRKWSGPMSGHYYKHCQRTEKCYTV